MTPKETLNEIKNLENKIKIENECIRNIEETIEMHGGEITMDQEKKIKQHRWNISKFIKEKKKLATKGYVEGISGDLFSQTKVETKDLKKLKKFIK